MENQVKNVAKLTHFWYPKVAIPFAFKPIPYRKIESFGYVIFTHISIFYIKQKGMQQFHGFNDAMYLHRNTIADKTLIDHEPGRVLCSTLGQIYD